MRKIKGKSLFLYAISGFGPNLLMTLVTAYLNDAFLAPAGLGPDKTFVGSMMLSAGLASIVFFIAKLVDAFIDIPLANFSDRFTGKLGKRRSGILIGWLPMVVSFLLLWNPSLLGGAGQTGLTWLVGLLLVIFYSSYTLCMISYYGTFSNIVANEKDRLKLSNFKAFFDTVQYAVAFALFPSLLLKILGGTEVGAVSSAINKLAPLMLTMIIPLFMIKYDQNEPDEVQKGVSLVQSFKAAVSSKSFRGWLITLLAMHMGLMLFLTGIGTTIPDGLLGIKGWQVTVMNSAAFAPVPIMLVIFHAIKKKRGIRFGLQTALLAFALSMFSFAAGWQRLWGGAGMTTFIIGLIASTIGSYGVGAFFTSSYFLPSQIAAKEISMHKTDNTAMYFAVQGLVTQIASAISVSLIYMNLVTKQIPLLGHTDGQLFLVPFIAGILMLLAFALSFFMDSGKQAS